MKYRIPEIGDLIRLTEPWTFALDMERRNETMYKFLPDRYEVPEWMLSVDWRKCGDTHSWRPGQAPVPIPDKPEGHRVTGVFGRIKAGQPIWFRKAELELHKRHDRGNGKGKATGADYYLSYNDDKPQRLTLPAGAELLVDRVYIRQGASKFSSVSFKWPKEKARFFVSLADAMDMEFDFVSHKTMYEGRAFNPIGG